MIEDGIAFVRNLAAGFSDASGRFGGSARRWTETAETSRAMWSDGAGRDVFQRFLDPHHGLLESAGPAVTAAVEAHDAALVSMTRAGEDARRAAIDAGQAAAACDRSHAQASAARQDIASVAGDIGRTKMMAHDVTNRLAAIAE